MPNLKTDRIAGMAPRIAALNVRRLMYQSLIWPAHLRDHARRLGPALDAEHMEGAADALIDRVRGNAELDGDLLGRQMLVDQQQGVQLALAEPGDAPGNFGIEVKGGRDVWPPFVLAVCEITLHQHDWLFTAKDKIKQKRSAVTEHKHRLISADKGRAIAGGPGDCGCAGFSKLVERAGFEPA